MMYLQRHQQHPAGAEREFMAHVNPLHGVPAPVRYAQRIGCCTPPPRKQLGGVFDALSSLAFIQDFLRS